MKNDKLSRNDCNVTMKTIHCVICDKLFTQNKLAYKQVTCGPECSKINAQNNKINYTKNKRKEFRDKYGIPSSRLFSEFIYSDLDQNPELLETLQLIKKITDYKLTPEQKKERNNIYKKEYQERNPGKHLEYGRIYRAKKRQEKLKNYERN